MARVPSFLTRSKQSPAMRRARAVLQNAIPVLAAVLAAQISVLDALLESNSGEYSRRDLARVLIAASNLHLKLKLTAAASTNLPLLQYLNPVDPSGVTFAASTLRIFNRLDTEHEEMLVVHYTELRNIFVYLLSRIERL